MQNLMTIFTLAAIVCLILLIIAVFRKKNKKKLLFSMISCLILAFIFSALSPKTDATKKKDLKATSAEVKKEQPKQSKEEPKKEEVKKEQPKEEKTQQEPVKEEPKKVENTDKTTYEQEMKPKIDAMINEYDTIWDEHWKPVWTELSGNPSAMNPNELKEKMDILDTKYTELSNKIVNFKDADKLSDATLKEKINNFRNEFVLASGYRGNAARSINQGIKGLAPMKDRMNAATKSVKLSDEKLIKALANLTTAETSIGVNRK
ncbi:TPA: DUF4064 domain-containing protein [Bacillus wiedmannii]